MTDKDINPAGYNYYQNVFHPLLKDKDTETKKDLYVYLMDDDQNIYFKPYDECASLLNVTNCV